MPAQEKNRKKKRGGYFAQNLLLLMKGCGLTQGLLAEELGFSQSAISNYLNGRIPKTDKLFALSNHLRVPVAELLYKDMKTDPGLREVDKCPDMVVRRRTPYDRLLERFESLSDEESERWARVFLKMMDELNERK
jgi:transcriptional regulator with XRE-family HTH domain